MNALASFPVHAEMTQVQLYALRDQLDFLINPHGVHYGAGAKAVTHKSGRRIFRAEALETLAFHRATECAPEASHRLAGAARRIGVHLAQAISLTFSEEA